MIYDSMNASGVAYWSMGPELVADCLSTSDVPSHKWLSAYIKSGAQHV